MKQYYALVAATVNSTALKYGSDDYYYDGYWYNAKLIGWPDPGDAAGNDYALLTTDSFDIVIDDADRSVMGYDDYWLNTTWTVTLIMMEDGQSTTFVRQMTCTGWTRQPGQIQLQLEDLTSTILEKLYPEHTYNADGSPATYPDLLDTDVGRPVPIVVGYGIKVPCALLHNNDGAGPWIYGVCEKLAGWYYDVDYVYRGTGDGGPIVSASEYTQTTYTGAGYDLVALSFTGEQTDYSGQPYTIWADLKADTADPPTTKYNAATEASRLLTWAGLTPDAASFSNAATVASTANMWVDWCYGRDSNQTTLQALLDKLLLVLRGQIYRADDGEWEIWQDTSGSSVASYDEDAGDLITVSNYQQPTIPATVKLAYQPDIADPGKLKHTLSRTISGGIGEVIYDAEMIRDFTAADYLHSYLKLRAQYAKTAEATVFGVQHSLGDIITVANDNLWSGNKNWIIRGIRRIPDGNQLDLLEYNATVYSYVAGTAPADGNTDAYGADYSATLPLSPSSFTTTGSPAYGVEAGNGGIYTAYVNLICTPPALNWKKIYFATSDGTVMTEGKPSGGNYTGTLRGLIPGKAYTLHAWAENAFGVSGLAGTVTTNYATLAHTAAADSAAPSASGSITVAQGTGKAFDVSWDAVADVDLKEYVLERKVGAGSYAEVYRGRATAKTDTKATLSYGSTYTYRVKAVDYSGNSSSYATSSGVALAYIDGSSEVRTISASYISTGSMSCDLLSGGTIDGQTISGGTITGSTVRTSSSNKRVEMTSSTNELRVYDGSGNDRGGFGVNTTDNTILKLGASSSCDLYGLFAENNSATRPTINVKNFGTGQAGVFTSGNTGSYTLSAQNTAGPALSLTAASGYNALYVATGNITLPSNGRLYIGSSRYLSDNGSRLVANGDLISTGAFFPGNQSSRYFWDDGSRLIAAGNLVTTGSFYPGNQATYGIGLGTSNRININTDLVVSNDIFVGGTTGVQINLNTSNDVLTFTRRGGTHNGDYLVIDFANKVTPFFTNV